MVEVLHMGHHSAETVEQAVANFFSHAITEIFNFAADKRSSRKRYGRKYSCFKNFKVDVAKTQFSEEAVAEFVQSGLKKKPSLSLLKPGNSF